MPAKIVVNRVAGFFQSFDLESITVNQRNFDLRDFLGILFVPKNPIIGYFNFPILLFDLFASNYR